MKKPSFVFTTQLSSGEYSASLRNGDRVAEEGLKESSAVESLADTLDYYVRELRGYANHLKLSER